MITSSYRWRYSVRLMNTLTFTSVFWELVCWKWHDQRETWWEFWKDFIITSLHGSWRAALSCAIQTNRTPPPPCVSFSRLRLFICATLIYASFPIFLCAWITTGSGFTACRQEACLFLTDLKTTRWPPNHSQAIPEQGFNDGTLPPSAAQTPVLSMWKQSHSVSRRCLSHAHTAVIYTGSRSASVGEIFAATGREIRTNEVWSSWEPQHEEEEEEEDEEGGTDTECAQQSFTWGRRNLWTESRLPAWLKKESLKKEWRSVSEMTLH